MKSYYPDGSPGVLTFIAAGNSDELVISDQSASSSEGMLIYVTAGTYVRVHPKKQIDRRRLTIKRDDLTLRYASRYNPSGSSAELDCYRKL